MWWYWEHASARSNSRLITAPLETSVILAVERIRFREVILWRAQETYPETKPRILSDNGPQFIARDFKEFVRTSGMTHVRTSP
jgi:transposase InsO family protein